VVVMGRRGIRDGFWRIYEVLGGIGVMYEESN
jgi:hypothetical protein